MASVDAVPLSREPDATPGEGGQEKLGSRRGRPVSVRGSYDRIRVPIFTSIPQLPPLSNTRRVPISPK